MRYIAIFLLVANIGYFIWAQTRTPQEELIAREPRDLLNTGLMLVSEFKEQAVAVALENAEDLTKCSFINGFSTVVDANGFILMAQERNLGALLNITGDPLPSQYRVFLPPAGNRFLATRVLDEVSEAISNAQLEVESYLITRGPLTEGVGLGVFTDKLAADLVQTQVSELGFRSEIEEIPRSNGEIQVVLRPPNSDQVDTAEWLELSDDRPNLTRTENLCETIAQASQFP